MSYRRAHRRYNFAYVLAELTHIERVLSNRGGLRHATIFFERDIVSMPFGTGGSLQGIGEMSLSPSARFVHVYFTRATGEHTQNTQRSASGDFYQNTIRFNSPGLRGNLELLVDRLRNRRVCIVYQDVNNVWRIVRNLRCTANMTTGRRGGYNGVSWTFSGASQRRATIWDYTPNAFFPESVVIPNVIGNPSENEVWGDPTEGQVWQFN